MSGATRAKTDTIMHLSFASIWEAVADATPDAPAVVHGARRISWRDYDLRAARLAQAFLDAGLGAHSKVGMYLYNAPEYCETNFAAMKIRGVPVNVSYRYLDDELAYLIEDSDMEALVYHSSLADRVAAVRSRAPRLKLFVEVDDGPAAGGRVPVAGAVGYDAIQAGVAPAARIAPQGDEIYMLYTGGTTGMPKGVMYAMTEFVGFFLKTYPSMIGQAKIPDPALIPEIARRTRADGTAWVSMSGPPLMHGTGCWLGMMVPQMLGGTAVLLEGKSFDPVELCSVVERERVNLVVVVGDAFAKPLLRALDERSGRFELSCLKLMVSSGTMFSFEVKQGLVKHIPELTIVDVLGSTEGGMGQSTVRAGMSVETARFKLNPTTKVFTADDREVTPGSGEIGFIANGGMVPLGYYKDPEKSARTFREVGGVRYAFPGDMATVEADGRVTLLGRGSNCINTGGEKVFPEEVEEALKTHPAVEDALVFGVPDERFGQRVVGVAALAKGAAGVPAAILAALKRHLASYKVPKELLVVERVPRAPNGKPDYATAKRIFESTPR
ncbi:MAG: AMP-binding protein [Myxococcales bacterium]|jgi:fatty-acyl-CoA synthase|nr:AMP-binding protein [Myxococcales bacterium]